MISKTIGLFVVVQLIAGVSCQCSPKDYADADDAFLFVTVFGYPKASFPTDEAAFDKICK